MTSIGEPVTIDFTDPTATVELGGGVICSVFEYTATESITYTVTIDASVDGECLIDSFYLGALIETPVDLTLALVSWVEAHDCRV